MKKQNEIPNIKLFSDGGAEPNPGIGGFGVIMSHKGQSKEFFKGYKLTTNNRMELMGVIFGLEKLKIKSNVQVYSDSKYVVDGIKLGWAKKWKQNNWKRKKNKIALNSDLWDKLLTLISVHSVNFNWVKGHAGHTENERCDYLATKGINSIELLDDCGFKFQEEKKGFKIEKAGDKCRKCNSQVIKKSPKKKKRKQNQPYYYEYYLFCKSCKTMYFVEDGKKYIQNEWL